MANNEAPERTAAQEAAVRQAFSEWVRRTRVRFAPRMGSVDETYRLWQQEHPDVCAAAIAAATTAPESGCDYCRNPLFASLKCPGCGRTATNGGA